MKSTLSTLFLCLAVGLTAQSVDELALTAYLNNDAAAWNKAITAAAELPAAEDRLLTLATLHQGAAYTAMSQEDGDAIDVHLKGMDEAIDAFWDLNEKSPAAHGLYAAYLGLKIARSPMSGMLYNAAGNLFYTPEQWGGDPAKALGYLETALATYDPATAGQNWEYLSALALTGQVQAKLGKTDAARATYERAIAEQPDFHYVSKYLLPALNSGK